MNSNQNFPNVLYDRIQVDIIRKKYPDVLEILRSRQIGKTENRDTVHFCGLASVEDGNSVFFLPRQTKATDHKNQMNLARMTMQVLARFGHEVESRKGAGRSPSSNASLIALIYDLVTDFRQNGIYSERVRFTSRNQGKPDWSRTLTSNLPLLSSKRKPVYSEVITQKSIDAHESPLSLIQAEVLREILSQHSWWLGGLESRANELNSFKIPKGTRNNWSKELKMYRQNLFSSRALYLVEALTEFLDNTGSESEGVFLYGVEDFQTVWEIMLRQVLPNVESGWNSRLPKPGYIRREDGSVLIQERGMQTDIITRTGNELKILDAKYYEATGIKTVPGWSDIVKQLFYEKAVKVVDPSLSVSSHFLFPTAKPREYEFAEIKLYDEAKNEVPSLSKIKCQYVETHLVMEAYSKKTKMNLAI